MSQPKEALNKKAKAGFVPEEAVEEIKEEVVVQEDTDGVLQNLPDDPAEKATKLSEMLSKFSSAPPSPQQLLDWKAKCGGEIFILYLFDKAYIYRALRRKEFTTLMSDEAYQKLDNFQREEHLVDRCLLWPKLSIVDKAASPAGLYSTLFNEVQSNSMFLDPQTCAALTVKL